MGAAPVVIAHRGASGYLPEHTLPAKALAHGLGADFLEQDVVATKDGQLVVFHDLHLDAMTDVAARFAGRARPDGRHYCIDFTLAEVRSLRLTERRRKDGAGARYPGRFPADTGHFRIHTLEEELAFIRGLNRSTGRQAGVYVEIKDPEWHAGQGIRLGARIIAVLADFGYRRRGDNFHIQCFSAGELRRVRNEGGGDLPLVQLLEDSDDVTPAGLATIATYANAIGPPLRACWPDRGLVAAAQGRGLAVHPYTFRADELPPGFNRFDDLVATFVDTLGVDGLFTDFPDLVVQQIRARAR